MRLHHIGWAVRSLEKSRKQFEDGLDLPFEGRETFPTLVVDFYAAENCLVELLEPSDDNDPTAQFLSEHGEGVHHLAFLVPDVQAALTEAANRGAFLIDKQPRVGARETMIGFIDLGRSDGVLFEYVEERR